MQQFILSISNNSTYNLNEFIISLSNQFVYDIIKKWHLTWGIAPYEFILLIYGPPSSGKTYLAQIWKNLSGAFIINNNNINIFNEEILHKNKTFIIEDIEKWEEKFILHYFNLINEHKKYLLLTTSELNNNFILQDLSSRIKSVLRLEIKQPDDELIKILIFKYFSNYSIRITNSVLQFLLFNLPRRFNQITQLLEKINYFALTYKRKITIPLIKEVLNNYK